MPTVSPRSASFATSWNRRRSSATVEQLTVVDADTLLSLPLRQIRFLVEGLLPVMLGPECVPYASYAVLESDIHGECIALIQMVELRRIQAVQKMASG